MSQKKLVFKKKWKTYNTKVTDFNSRFKPRPKLQCPNLDETAKLPITDPFWDFGALTHPEEPWAVDKNTQDGIQAYLEVTHGEDELRRISRELRQLVKWALATNNKMESLAVKVRDGEWRVVSSCIS